MGRRNNHRRPTRREKVAEVGTVLRAELGDQKVVKYDKMSAEAREIVDRIAERFHLEREQVVSGARI